MTSKITIEFEGAYFTDLSPTWGDQQRDDASLTARFRTSDGLDAIRRTEFIAERCIGARIKSVLIETDPSSTSDFLDPTPTEVPRADQILGAREVAKMCRRSGPWVSQRVTDPNFPALFARVSATPLWWKSDIRAWIRNGRRLVHTA